MATRENVERAIKITNRIGNLIENPEFGGGPEDVIAYELDGFEMEILEAITNAIAQGGDPFMMVANRINEINKERPNEEPSL